MSMYVWNIYIYIYLPIFGLLSVGKYSSPIEHMGIQDFTPPLTSETHSMSGFIVKKKL